MVISINSDLKHRSGDVFLFYASGAKTEAGRGVEKPSCPANFLSENRVYSIAMAFIGIDAFYNLLIIYPNKSKRLSTLLIVVIIVIIVIVVIIIIIIIIKLKPRLFLLQPLLLLQFPILLRLTPAIHPHHQRQPRRHHRPVGQRAYRHRRPHGRKPPEPAKRPFFPRTPPLFPRARLHCRVVRSSGSVLGAMAARD